MSDHWIKVKKSMNDSPKMMIIASMCNCSEDTAFACWFRLFCYFDSHTDNGHLPYLFGQKIDQIARLEGLANALIQIGWITFDETGCFIVEYDKHNGSSAKKRLVTSERVVKHRKEGCNAKSVTVALHV